MKNRILIIICIFAVAASAAVILLSRRDGTEQAAAEILRDGEVLQKIDLSSVSESYDVTVEADGGGYNTVHITRNGVSVSDADCPDKLCVNMGEISGSAYPIVCLPHRLVVRIVSGSGGTVDAVTGR